MTVPSRFQNKPVCPTDDKLLDKWADVAFLKGSERKMNVRRMKILKHRASCPVCMTEERKRDEPL